MQLARAIAVVGRRLRDDLQVDHLVQHRMGIVPVVGIALGDQALVRGPLLECEGAVGDDVARLDPLMAKLLDDRLGRREGGVVGQGLQEEGDRVFQGDLQGVGIDRLDAERLWCLFALDDVTGVDHAGQLDEPGVVGGVLGVGRPLPAIDVIGRGDRLAVGPLGLGSELEGVDCAGAVQLVTERARGSQLAVAVQAIESLEQIVDDVAARALFCHLGIDGGGLGADVAHEGLLVAGQQLGAIRHLGRQGGEGEQGGNRAGNESPFH
ncbi:hypothetical protein D3C79_673740 [compost metagenome]